MCFYGGGKFSKCRHLAVGASLCPTSLKQTLPLSGESPRPIVILRCQAKDLVSHSLCCAMFEILRFAQEDRSSLQRHFGVAGDMAPDVDRDGQARNVRGGNLDIHRQCRGFAAEALRTDTERIDAF